MNKKNIIISIFLSIFFSSCGTNFLGAQSYINQGGLYVERWYLNPQYNKKDLPKGTAFYGKSAEKIRNKFTIKYYIAESKGDSIREIPSKDMWKVKHNGLDDRVQNDDNLFLYEKTNNNIFKKYTVIFMGAKLPIKECYTSGWCKLYITNRNINHEDKILYVKKSVIYK